MFLALGFEGEAVAALPCNGSVLRLCSVLSRMLRHVVLSAEPSPRCRTRAVLCRGCPLQLQCRLLPLAAVVLGQYHGMVLFALAVAVRASYHDSNLNVASGFTVAAAVPSAERCIRRGSPVLSLGSRY